MTTDDLRELAALARAARHLIGSTDGRARAEYRARVEAVVARLERG